MRIKNWHKFQHFKDRRPPWIKLYRDLLDDIQYHNLDPVAAKALTLIWLIASEFDGTIPTHKILAFRLRMSEKQISVIIPMLSHWLEQDDISAISNGYQNDPLETETETETEERRLVVAPKALPKTRGTRLSDDWSPSPESQNFAISKVGGEGAIQELDKFRDYWLSTPGQRGLKLDWDRTWKNWIRNANQGNYNGSRGSRPLQDDSKSASRAAGRLAEAARRGEFKLDPRPSLLPGKDESSVVLLSSGRIPRP